ncbi:hypothetical protein GF352_01505 [archaeon]|nr:hypothetical protein [archaeon]
MTVMVCAAHPDDEVIGLGGTIAKLSETERVVSIIFSLGDKYPFWKRRKEIKKDRVNETRACEQILGIKKTHFLGLKDLEIKKNKNKALKKLKKLLSKYKPSRVFTHTRTDGHPDHRAVHEVTVEAVAKSFIKTQLLTFDVSFFNFQKGLKVCYDISDTFGKKMKAINEVKSQRTITMLLKPLILLKAVLYGLQNKCKYAECFKSL